MYTEKWDDFVAWMHDVRTHKCTHSFRSFQCTQNDKIDLYQIWIDEWCTKNVLCAIMVAMCRCSTRSVFFQLNRLNYLCSIWKKYSLELSVCLSPNLFPRWRWQVVRITSCHRQFCYVLFFFFHENKNEKITTKKNNHSWQLI